MFKRLKKPLKKILRKPFNSTKKKQLIVHCSHHRSGTTWFLGVLSDVANYFALNITSGDQIELRNDTDIFFQQHSIVDAKKLPQYRGTHMIRDPRDLVVSSYFYHKWTKEKWAHIPKKEFGNKTYQQYLNSVSQEDGIVTEMNRIVNWEVKYMLEWEYDNPNFLEIKYENIIFNQDQIFNKIFRHYGFNDKAIRASQKIAKRHNFENKTNRKLGEIKDRSHLRSGLKGQWEKVFIDKHKVYFKELLGDSLIKLGYENNYDW